MSSLLLPMILTVTSSLSLPAGESPATPPSSSAPVRVMSYNIRYGTAKDGENDWELRKEFLAETIRSYDPDLLGTQEVLGYQRDFLALKLPEYQVFSAGRDDGKEAGEMAAIYFRSERFEKLDGGHFWLSETPDTPGSKGWDAALPRLASWVKLRDRRNPDSAPILFLNTHLDHRGRQSRIEAARLIRSKIEELSVGCRPIVTGDFNSGEGSEPYRALFAPGPKGSAPLVDTYRVMNPVGGTDEGTFSGFKADQTTGQRIDWIGCSPDWEVRLAGIDRTQRNGRTPSDHFAVTAVLRASAPAEKTTLRVLCYNIHHGEGTDGKINLPRIAKLMRDADADLIALQEVDSKTRRANGVDQTAEFGRLTGMHAKFGKAIDYSGGEYGQAILSRFPIANPKVHTLPGEPDREQRIAFEVQLTAHGHPLTFITTHLHHLSAEFRERQAQKINEIFAASERPMILAGDMNATPEAKPLDRLREHWLNATDAKGLFTYPSDKPNKQIDYILCRPSTAFRVVSSKVIDEPVASDHRPILVVLEWQGK